jgi:hypothetical protein
MIARACAIFQVEEIYIYHEAGGNIQDTKLITTLLKYLETPQYFRKYLYPKMRLLKSAGTIHPIQISHHTTTSNPQQIMAGDIREAIIIDAKGKKFIEIGINKLLAYFGKGKSRSRITIQFKTGYPNFSYKEISKEQIKEYWGYRVKEVSNLFSLLNSWSGNIILTSRKGKIFSQKIAHTYLQSKNTVLVVFGSPKRGLYDILGGNIKNIKNSQICNFFPNQATETVRLEEALLGTLSILNHFRSVQN